MTLIKYNDYSSIVVEFEDGFKKEATYGSFKKGKIKNPNFKNSVRKDRTGEQRFNYQGCLMEVIEFINSSDMTIEFQDEYKYKVKTNSSNFLSGRINNLFFKSYYNVGYLGDYKGKGNICSRKSFGIWRGMIERCYSKSSKKYKTYGLNGITVCNDWHCYTNFEDWYDSNYYEVDNENMCIDKDIISDTKIYSPETCIIIPEKINEMFVGIHKTYKNGLSNGIRIKNNKYCARIKENRKEIYLGAFDNINDAILAYKKEKLRYMISIIESYKEKIPKNTYNLILSSWYLKKLKEDIFQLQMEQIEEENESED